VNFSPAVSRDALKAMRQTIRGWHLQLKSDKSLADLSAMFAPILKGWQQYYGRFHGSALKPVWRSMNLFLIRWLMRKHPLLFGNELEEASDLVGWAISRANLGEGAPKEFPRRLIPLFQSFGDTLRDDEAMLLSSPNTTKPSRYDKVIKERILQWATTQPR
jgi:hypothetical protein